MNNRKSIDRKMIDSKLNFIQRVLLTTLDVKPDEDFYFRGTRYRFVVYCGYGIRDIRERKLDNCVCELNLERYDVHTCGWKTVMDSTLNKIINNPEEVEKIKRCCFISDKEKDYLETLIGWYYTKVKCIVNDRDNIVIYFNYMKGVEPIYMTAPTMNMFENLLEGNEYTVEDLDLFKDDSEVDSEDYDLCCDSEDDSDDDEDCELE